MKLARAPQPNLARDAVIEAPQSDVDLAWRTRNVGRRLFAATAVFLHVKLRVVNAGEGPALTPAQSLLLQNLDRDGSRLSHLAARIALPKQTLGEYVDRAEAMGLVARLPDPGDGRAKRVAFTPAGRAALERLRVAVAEAERRMGAVIGAEFLRSIKVRLGEYLSASDLAPLAADLTRTPGRAGWAAADMGRLTVLARRVFVADVLRVVREGGASITDVQLSLFRNLDLAGSRLTDIAACAAMSKPAMAEIVDRAVSEGWVQRRPDPSDGRAKVVELTPRGRDMLALVGRGVAAAEARMGVITDPAFVDDLRAALGAYVEAEGEPRPVDAQNGAPWRTDG